MPIAYAVFAFALGANCGLLIRQTCPATAATRAGFTVIRVAVTLWLRPHFAAPVTNVLATSVVAASGAPAINGSSITDNGGWVLSVRITGSGATAREIVTSQPLNRFWTFQWLETGLFLTLAALLLYVAVYQLRSRTT